MITLLLLLLPEIILINNKNEYFIRVKEDFSELQECIKTSEYKYRIKYKFCYRRKNWLDNCTDELQQNTWVSFNPISGIYQVTKDLRKDSKPERVKNFDNIEDAIKEVTSTEILKIKTKENKRNYISVNFNSECQNTRTYDRALFKIFSFGIFSNKKTESDWVDFEINSDK